MKHQEDDLQKACFMWFSYHYPGLKGLLFAVPNGGHRNIREAARLKSAGVVAGVSDMILLRPNKHYSSLCIEFKIDKGKQTDYQKQWQFIAELWGNKYIIIRSLDEFISEITNYGCDIK